MAVFPARALDGAAAIRGSTHQPCFSSSHNCKDAFFFLPNPATVAKIELSMYCCSHRSMQHISIFRRNRVGSALLSPKVCVPPKRLFLPFSPSFLPRPPSPASFQVPASHPLSPASASLISFSPRRAGRICSDGPWPPLGHESTAGLHARSSGLCRRTEPQARPHRSALRTAGRKRLQGPRSLVQFMLPVNYVSTGRSRIYLAECFPASCALHSTTHLAGRSTSTRTEILIPELPSSSSLLSLSLVIRIWTQRASERVTGCEMQAEISIRFLSVTVNGGEVAAVG